MIIKYSDNKKKIIDKGIPVYINKELYIDISFEYFVKAVDIFSIMGHTSCYDDPKFDYKLDTTKDVIRNISNMLGIKMKYIKLETRYYSETNRLEYIDGIDIKIQGDDYNNWLSIQREKTINKILK